MKIPNGAPAEVGNGFVTMLSTLPLFVVTRLDESATERLMRILSIVCGGLLLAGCSSKTPDNGEPSGDTGGSFSSGGESNPGGGGFPVGSGGFPAGSGGFPVGSGGFPASSGGFPAGSGGSPAGSGGLPAGTGGGPGSSGGVPASGGAPGSGGTTSTGPTFTGCDSDVFLNPPTPADPSTRGAWDVGVQTVTIGRLTAEVMYPAQPGSTAGKPEATYDLRKWLPADQQSLVPDADSPAVGPSGGHLYRDVPIDGAHGPYPVIIMIHGTGAFRIASGSLNTQWASRGTIVIAADYPGLFLTDQLCSANSCKSGGTNSLGKTVKASADCGTVGSQDIPGDVKTQLDAVTSPTGGLAFLAGHADVKHVGIAGHSQGACVAASEDLLPNVELVMPYDGALSVNPATALKAAMFVSGLSDKVMPYGAPSTEAAGAGPFVCSPVAPEAGAVSTLQAYTSSPMPPVDKWLVGITGGGHLVPTDLCQDNAQNRNAIQEAEFDAVCGIDDSILGLGLPSLFDCGTIALPDAVHTMNYVTTPLVEQVLQCQDRSMILANLDKDVSTIGDFHHSP
jgi:hypothetical protein